MSASIEKTSEMAAVLPPFLFYPYFGRTPLLFDGNWKSVRQSSQGRNPIAR